MYEEELFTYNAFHPLASLVALGERTGQGNAGDCYGTVRLRILYKTWATWGGSGAIDTKYSLESVGAFSYGSQVMINSRNFNEQIENFADGAIAEFAADVISQRRNSDVKRMLSDFEHLKKPMTRRELEELLSTTSSKDLR